MPCYGRTRRLLAKREHLTAERLRDVLIYNPETGEFNRRVSAGSINANGYRVIEIDGFTFHASHLAILYMTGKLPVGIVDHKNLNRGDNSYDNLRECSLSQNQANTGPRKGRKFKGVYAERGKWTARMHVYKIGIYLGTFETEREAALAYDAAAREHWGPFARTNFPIDDNVPVA